MNSQLIKPAKPLLLSALFLSTALMGISSYADTSSNIIRTPAPVRLAYTPPENTDNEEEKEDSPAACYDPNNVGKVGTYSKCKGLLIVENGGGKFGIESAVRRGILVDGKSYGAEDIFTGQVTDMSFLFRSSTAQNVNTNIDIDYWDTSNVTDMTRMFGDSDFNQYIGSWDVSNVSIMEAMFYYSSVFNQDLSEWCVVNFTANPPLFDSNALENSNKPVWGTCPRGEDQQ